MALFDDSLSFRLRSVDCNRGLSYSPCGPACPPVPGALHPAASAHHGLPEGASVCTNTRICTGGARASFLGTVSTYIHRIAVFSLAQKQCRRRHQVVVGLFELGVCCICNTALHYLCASHTPVCISAGTSHSFYWSVSCMTFFFTVADILFCMCCNIISPVLSSAVAIATASLFHRNDQLCNFCGNVHAKSNI